MGTELGGCPAMPYPTANFCGQLQQFHQMCNLNSDTIYVSVATRTFVGICVAVPTDLLFSKCSLYKISGTCEIQNGQYWVAEDVANLSPYECNYATVTVWSVDRVCHPTKYYDPQTATTAGAGLGTSAGWTMIAFVFLTQCLL